jgi:hypothetical protein
LFATALLLSHTPSLHAQSARPGRASAFTEIKWDDYTFKFLPGNQMAQVLDANGQVIGTILSQNGALQMLPTLTGDAAAKLKQSFQAWKDQGGEKALTATAKPLPSRPGRSDAKSPASTPAAASAPTAEDPAPEPKSSGPAILHADDLEHLDNGAVHFDLAAMRAHPELLAQKSVMQYFIALNNCNDTSVQRALQNELDYPALVKVYQPKAAEILAGLPDTAGLLMFRGNTKGAMLWGHATGGYDPNLKTLTLGEYDLNRKAFPILVSDKGKSFQVTGTQQVSPDRSSLQKSCPVAYNMVGRSGASTGLPTTYSVTVAPMSFGELPMTEAAARKYIEGTNAGQRGVVLGVDVHLKPNPQKSSAKELAYDGTVARVTVLKDVSYQQVGVLYDDHTLPPATVKVIPSAITTMKSTREFNEEVITAVYVSLAADECGWQITPEQKANLKRYISDVSTYGKFNDRSTINGVLANIRNSINDPSVHFCENPTERQDFARRSATVWPKGAMAAPAPPAN